MLAKLVQKSLFRNLRLTAWVVISLAACASLVTVFLILSMEVNQKMRGELRKLGANAFVAWKGTQGNGQASAWQKLEEMSKEEQIGFLFAAARIGLIQGKPMVVVSVNGVNLFEMTPYWAVEGEQKLKEDFCLVGRQVADSMRWKVNDAINIEWDKNIPPLKSKYTIAGFIESGDEDENRIFIPQGNLAAFGEETLRYALLSIPGGERGLEQFNKRLSVLSPYFQLNPLFQILHGEEIILGKITLLCQLTLFTVVLLTSLGVSSVLAARVVYREKELALIHALGGKRKDLMRLLLSESSATGFIAALLGIQAGAWMTARIVQQIFHVSVQSNGYVFLLTVLFTLLTALLTNSISVYRALKIQPANALRGE